MTLGPRAALVTITRCTFNPQRVPSVIRPEMNHRAKHWAETGGLAHHHDKLLKLLVGPAGPPQIRNINGLARPETVEFPDASRCLSQSIVSAEPPDKPRMRSPAAANGRANRKFKNTKNSTSSEEYSQSETAIAAAMRVALSRKTVR